MVDMPWCLSQQSWFAVQVKPKCERVVAELLRNKGYETFLPVNRAAPKCPPLFPSYVFCRFDSGVKAPIVTTAGVIRIVGFSGRAAAIDPAEMSSLIAAYQAGENLRPTEHFCDGDRVELSGGPLRGCSGVLLHIDERLNFVVSISLLRRSVALVVRPDWLIRKPECSEVRDPRRVASLGGAS
jgi:transcription antitermination factor NusG